MVCGLRYPIRPRFSHPVYPSFLTVWPRPAPPWGDPVQLFGDLECLDFGVLGTGETGDSGERLEPEQLLSTPLGPRNVVLEVSGKGNKTRSPSLPHSSTHLQVLVLILINYIHTHTHSHTILDAIQPYNTTRTIYTQKATLATSPSSPSTTTFPGVTSKAAERNLIDGQVVPRKQQQQQQQHNGNFNNWWCRRAGVDNTLDAGCHKDNEIITRIEFP